MLQVLVQQLSDLTFLDFIRRASVFVIPKSYRKYIQHLEGCRQAKFERTAREDTAPRTSTAPVNFGTNLRTESRPPAVCNVACRNMHLLIPRYLQLENITQNHAYGILDAFFFTLQMQIKYIFMHTCIQMLKAYQNN